VLYFVAAHLAPAIAWAAVADPHGVAGSFYHARIVAIVHSSRSAGSRVLDAASMLVVLRDAFKRRF
jgi:hypothetical protein